MAGAGEKEQAVVRKIDPIQTVANQSQQELNDGKACANQTNEHKTLDKAVLRQYVIVMRGRFAT